MKWTVSTAIAIILISPSAYSLEFDCKNDTSQAAINFCLGAEAEQQKAKLQDYVKKKMEVLSCTNKTSKPCDTNNLDNFKKSQRSWQKYLEDQCKYEADLFKGGSMYAGVSNSCQDFITKQRLELLKNIDQKG
jgi:uncharacterized protein YecT (DUF1311 family)